MLRKLALVVAGAAMALCIFGCSGTPGTPVGTQMLQVGSASVDYPATWKQSDMTQGTLLGIDGSSAKLVTPENGSGGFVAVSDLSKSGLTLEEFQESLQGTFDGTVNETTVEGRDGLKLTQDTDNADYTAYVVAGEDGETLSAALVAELPDNSSDEVESQFNEIVESFNLK
ncbi:MAG: hypothetical protein HFJ66_08625 [Eggerthellaceae bacterium]|nr:hypothetical protein [Eggerthellaceae bacterium]